MMTSFPKRIKSLSRKGNCNANAKFKDYVFDQRLFTFQYICISVHLYGKLFSKTCALNLALAFQLRILD